MTGDRCRRFLYSLRRYLMFFLFMGVVVASCLLTFLSLVDQSSDFKLSPEQIHNAGVLTLCNLILQTLLLTVLDMIRRKWLLEHPVKRIIAAAEKIMKGDFSVRIQPISRFDTVESFDAIIGYINRMAEELSGIETLRTDFISNVSHELKTPLSVIQNYSIMLQQPGLPEEQTREYAKAIADTSRRLSELITNILKLNKLENQQIYPRNETYDLGEQICQCLLLFENVWEEKEIELETSLKENVFIASDAELMTLVWNNLISNALKFTKPGGRVTVTLDTEGEFAVARFQDTGCGIPPEVGKHIFEKFYQGDTSHAEQGNGLGLALVKRVMDIAGGDIAVDSKVGKGSVFTVKIRRKENPYGNQ